MTTDIKDEAGHASEVERLVAAARDSLSDEMVGRLAGFCGDGMDMMDKVSRSGLSKAIPVIAEMVNNGDLERITQLARVYQSAQDAMTDEMVGRMAGLYSDTLDMVDRANRSGLSKAIPVIAEMVNNGDLERISQLARVYQSAQDALTDEMVGRMAETVGEGLSLLDRLNRGGVGRLVQMMERLEATGALEKIATQLPVLLNKLDTVAGLLTCLETAASQSRQQTSSGGLGNLWQLMTHRDTQQSLRFLVQLSQAMQDQCAKH